MGVSRKYGSARSEAKDSLLPTADRLHMCPFPKSQFPRGDMKRARWHLDTQGGKEPGEPESSHKRQ